MQDFIPLDKLPPYAVPLAEFGIILIACVLAYQLTKRVLLRMVARLVRSTPTTWDDVFLDKGVFNRLAWIPPAIVLYYAAYRLDGQKEELLQRFLLIYINVLFILVLTRVLSAVNELYQRTERAKQFPIKGYVQVAQLIVALLGIIVLFATVLDKSPWGILSGLGAATAILLLVFRDTILSFVASIQLTTNDMVRVGDWITMPQFGADGDVVDVALYTVKVQNWDKTISTIPTHKLMQDSFRNWRNMKDVGGRRIKRSLMLDTTSIRFLEAPDLERFSKVSLLRPYLEEKTAELERWNAERGVDPQSPINARRLTNVGTFRAYLVAFLRAHPSIRQDLTFIIRTLEPTPEGLPLQVYVFVNDTVWARYEAVQSDLFDHILAAVPIFDLRLFQRPSGHDMQQITVSA